MVDHLTGARPLAALQARLCSDLTSAPTEQDAQYGNVVEASFGGYAPVAIGTGVAALNGSFQGEMDSPTLTWTADATIAGPETITGVYVTGNDGSNDLVLFFWYLGADQVFSADGDTMSRVIDLLATNLP